MSTRSKNSDPRSALVAALAFFVPAQLIAQNAPPPATATPPAAPAAPASAAPLNINTLESNTLVHIIDKAFDTNSDSVNPEDGTLNWKGKTFNIGQFRAFRARFERYLSLPDTSDHAVHQAIVNEVASILSTRAGDDAGADIKHAWQLLYRAAEYAEDGGASIAVANQVFNAWRIRDEKEALLVTQIELGRIRRQQQGAVTYSGDLIAREGASAASDVAGNLNASASTPSTPATTSNNNNNNTTGGGTVTTGDTTVTLRGGNNNRRSSGSSNGSGSSRDTAGSQTAGPVAQFFRTRELAETEAKIKASEAGALMTAAQAKLQFQTQIVSLFLQRRFQHAMIAANFYRYIFKGSAQNLEVGKKELSEFLPSSDLAITVETLETLSREAINDINASMQAVNAAYEDGQLTQALERLQETFFLGEYVTSVATFELPKKQKLLELYQKVDEARKLADLKDYEAVASLVESIGGLTKDFRAAEVSSALRSAQRMSTLALHAARQAAASGDILSAQTAVEKAAQLWPLNPAIQTYSENMANQVDIGSQATQLFDDALRRSDYRRIYDQRSELAVGLMQDIVRGPELKDIIERMTRLEIYLTQAKEFLAQDNAFAAWEALALATPLSPGDVQLNQRKAELAPRVANFVGRIDTARRHEEEGRHASALTHYLAAQDIYPASTLARTGVERVSTALLVALTPQPEPTNG